MEKAANVASVYARVELAVVRDAGAGTRTASHVKGANRVVQLTGSGPVGRVVQPDSAVRPAEGVSGIVLAHVKGNHAAEKNAPAQAGTVSSATNCAAPLMDSSLVGAPGVGVTSHVEVAHRTGEDDAAAENAEESAAPDPAPKVGTATRSAAR